MEILDEKIKDKSQKKINWIAFFLVTLFIALIFLGWVSYMFFYQQMIIETYVLALGKIELIVSISLIALLIIFYEIICSAIVSTKLFGINRGVFIQIFFFLSIFFLFVFFIIMIWGDLIPRYESGTLVPEYIYDEYLEFKSFPNLIRFLFVQGLIIVSMFYFKNKTVN